MAILAPASYYFSACCFYYLNNVEKHNGYLFFSGLLGEFIYDSLCLVLHTFFYCKNISFFVATQLLVQIRIIATTIASTSHVFAMSRRHARDVTGAPMQFLLGTVELQDGSTRHLAEM